MTPLFILLTIFISTPSLARQTEWSLHLDTKLEGIFFSEVYAEETDSSLLTLELTPLYDWRYKEKWRLNLSPHFIASQSKSEDERYFFDPAESNLRFKGESYFVAMGYNIFSWGVTDGYNPVDIINSKQYFDPLQSKKLGALSIHYSQSFANWDYDLVYIPENHGAILPGTKSRWLPRHVYVPETPSNDLILLLPENLRYKYTPRENFDHALSNNAALRIQYRGSSIDMTLSGYEGVAGFPLVQPVVTGTIVEVSPKTVLQVDPDVTLDTTNYRIRQTGFTFVSNQFNFLFKLASSYVTPLGDHEDLPGWSNENVLGLEKTFSLGDDGVLIGILQHSFLVTERTNDSNLSFSEIFRRAWMLGGKATWQETWSFSLLALYDQIRGSHYEEIEFGKRFGDAWVAKLSINLIEGPADTPLGVYNKNDSVAVSLSRSF